MSIFVTGAKPRAAGVRRGVRGSILRGGIGLTWPNEVDFSADGLPHDAFPDEPTSAAVGSVRSPRHPVARE
jgi:hypothetical protein